MADDKLIWERISNESGLVVDVARMEDTEDGWECTAVYVKGGSSFPRRKTTEVVCVTIVKGHGNILHDNQFKEYGPNKRYLFACDKWFFLRAADDEDTVLELTAPQK